MINKSDSHHMVIQFFFLIHMITCWIELHSVFHYTPHAPQSNYWDIYM